MINMVRDLRDAVGNARLWLSLSLAISRVFPWTLGRHVLVLRVFL